MSKKRSRVGQSQSFGDITTLNQQQPSPELLWDAALPVDVPDQSRPSILTVSSPPLMYEMVRGNGDCFLERCYHCKKMLDQNKNIYMYGDSAFCTLECREAQIAIDKATVETGTRTSGRGMNRS
ncbi:protein INCREASED RESISTANCE TO MYZUS PERSICAE 1 isoform X1 [Hevea brasiliensis]|uniref:protein INCREASED RESISTANCE TO MYZUS PERSICAE 1 isoform X1 n=1 Tax=Hevea brasiliensis TaxID=3981 RepID=UPI0025ECBABC|nr:protein INCREASED RESISTANCE TO MYZUS PERSICAE 1 isoform X1 [Hevea brasiliensis]